MTTPQLSGLARWRDKQAEERRLKLLELEFYRRYATEEERDGRMYRVVRIPDSYTFGRKDAA